METRTQNLKEIYEQDFYLKMSTFGIHNYGVRTMA
jgi:hypothetical protein